MAKLSKSTKSVIIAAAVLLVLGAVLMVLMLTQPAQEEPSSEPASSAPDTSVDITDKQADNVLSLTVDNETGSFTFERQKRVKSTTDSEGNVSVSDEYYWTSPEMKEISPNDSLIRAFVKNMAGLSTKSLVEENAEDLDKYGLQNPLAAVSVNFDDGSGAKLCFGITNPASTSNVYFCEEGSRDVHQVSYYSAGSAYYDIRDFVALGMTEVYNTDNPQQLDYLIINRKDLDEPVEIRYMYDVELASEDEDSVITTFNTHRLITPITAEVDSTKGQNVCYGVYGLAMSGCVYLEKTEETLAATGLDDPFVTVKFKYGGKVRELMLGDEIVKVTETDDENTPALTTVTGYYAMMEGVDGIYSIAKDSAPWYSFTVQDIMSRRPVSPYIYCIDTLTVETPDGSYAFTVEGDSTNHTFTCGGNEVDDSKFRQLYQHLITAIGEELYFDEPETQPVVTVRFKYRSEYTDLFGTDEDVIEFYSSDDRKSIVRVNGTVLFKVRQVYTERLISNVKAVLEGGDVVLDW